MNYNIYIRIILLKFALNKVKINFLLFNKAISLSLRHIIYKANSPCQKEEDIYDLLIVKIA